MHSGAEHQQTTSDHQQTTSGAERRQIGQPMNSNRCELPGDDFNRLAGDHVCEDHESFRSGFCYACADVIESEGLCGHGSYPDGCGHAHTVCVIEWKHATDSEWIPEVEPFQCGDREAEETTWSALESILADTETDADDSDSYLPEYESVRSWSRDTSGAAATIEFTVRHCTGVDINVRLRRGH